MTRTTQPAAASLSLTLRPAQPSDGAALHDLIAACPPLDLNSRYAYLLHCLHHAQTSVLAEISGKLVGAITAYRPPQQPDTLFVWQVAVAEQQRGQGLGNTMLEHLLSHCINAQPLHWMETTISPSNQASHRLFSRFSRQHKVECKVTPLFPASAFGGVGAGGGGGGGGGGNAAGHEEEQLYRLGRWEHAGPSLATADRVVHSTL